MWQKNVRYLDYNASSGVSSFVKEKLLEVITREEVLANPSSRHRLGQSVQHLIYEASLRVAQSLGSQTPDELIFTSSGTESNQTILRSMAKDAEGLIIGAGEHSASHDLLEDISLQFLRELPLLQSGHYDFEALANLLIQAKEQGLTKVALSLFWANNETGVLTDLVALKQVIESSGISVLLHLDGAQAWGKIPVDVNATPAHYISFSAHKIGAPAGVGVIWKRVGHSLHSLIPGTQNKGDRGGTENTLGIIATGAAASVIDPLQFIEHTRSLQTKLEAGLQTLSHPVSIWGLESTRVSNTTRFSLPDFRSYENWVELLDLHGFAVSHGSACKARVIEPSRVLLKMGVNRNEALNSLRISFGPSNTLADVDEFLAALETILIRKRESLSKVGMKA